MGIFITAALLLVVAVVLWSQSNLDRTVLDRQTITVESRHGHETARAVPTRRVRRGTLEFEEVNLGDNTWIDCGGDCVEAYRVNKLDFWETQRHQQRE